MFCKAQGSGSSCPGAEGAALLPQHHGRRAVRSSNPACAGESSLLGHCPTASHLPVLPVLLPFLSHCLPWL